MAEADNVSGEIHDQRKHVSVEWKIENYFSLPQKADRSLESPVFHFLNASWYLRLFPNGERHSRSVGYLDLYLINDFSETGAISLNFNLGIKSGSGQIYKQVGHTCTIGQENGFGEICFLERNELLRNRDVIAPDGTLTVFFVSKQSPDVSDASSQTASVDGTRSLSEDFHSLFNSKEKSDVLIKLKRREFQAHKLVLGARSTVFTAMFKHDMKESVSGVVNLEDYDPDIFQEFLLFMYTGQIQELTSHNVFELFTVADKYDVGYLKELCLDFIKNNLTLDTACNVFAMADKHGEEGLKNSAKKMIVRNLKTLLPTEQWIAFLRDNPNLATELLMTVIPDNIEL